MLVKQGGKGRGRHILPASRITTTWYFLKVIPMGDASEATRRATPNPVPVGRWLVFVRRCGRDINATKGTQKFCPDFGFSIVHNRLILDLHIYISLFDK